MFKEIFKYFFHFQILELQKYLHVFVEVNRVELNFVELGLM